MNKKINCRGIMKKILFLTIRMLLDAYFADIQDAYCKLIVNKMSFMLFTSIM